METLANLLLFLLPFERLPTRDIFGITVRLSSLVIIIFILALPWLIKKLELSKIDKVILIFYLITLLSILVATDRRRALVVAALFGFVLFGYFLISRVYRKSFDFSKASRLIVFSAFLTSLFGFYQFFGNSWFGLSSQATGLLPRYTKEILGFARVQSTGMEPLYYANFLFLPIFILSFRVLAKKRLPAFEYFALLLILLAFILAFSRGAYIGFAAGSLVILASLVRFPEFRLNAIKLIIIYFLAFGLSQLSVLEVSGKKGVETFSEHVVVTEENRGASVNPRIESYGEAIRLFRQKPFLGVGIGNYGVVNRFEKNIPLAGYTIVNNQYLETLAETGIIGFLALFFLIYLLLQKLYRGLWHNRTRLSALALSATLIGILVQYNFFSTIYILFIWVVIALIEAMPLGNDIAPGQRV